MRFALLLTLCASLTFGQQQPNNEWRIRYFYDNARETLHFVDIASPTPDRAVAVGSIVDETKRRIRRHLALITSDAGAHWSEESIGDEPRSLFFLNNSLGWMVTAHGVWRSEESGHAWKRIGKHNGSIGRVWFLDANHGFAAG